MLGAVCERVCKYFCRNSKLGWTRADSLESYRLQQLPIVADQGVKPSIGSAVRDETDVELGQSGESAMRNE